MKENVVLGMINLFITIAIVCLLLAEHEQMSDTMKSVLGFVIISSTSLFICMFKCKNDTHGQD